MPSASPSSVTVVLLAGQGEQKRTIHTAGGHGEEKGSPAASGPSPTPDAPVVATSAPLSATPSASPAVSAATSPPTIVAAATDDKVVVLDSATGAIRRVLAEFPLTPPPGAYPRPRVTGVTVSPDRKWVYYGYDQCETATIFRVPMAGGSPPEAIATGVAPAVSPDGTKVAYAAHPARFGGPKDPSYGCYTALVARDLRTGEEAGWYPKPPPPELNVGSGEHGVVVGISWSLDGRRVAFSTCYEGCGAVNVLDISRRGFLYETAEQTKIGASDIAWQASTGHLAVVVSCCYGDEEWTQPPVGNSTTSPGNWCACSCRRRPIPPLWTMTHPAATSST